MTKYAANMGRSPIAVFYELINIPATRTPGKSRRSDKMIENAAIVFSAYRRLSENFTREIECGEILTRGITQALFAARVGSLKDCETITHHALFTGDLRSAIHEYQEEKRVREEAHLDVNPATRREGLSGNRLNVLDHIDMYRDELDGLINDDNASPNDVKAIRHEIERLTELLMTPDYA